MERSTVVAVPIDVAFDRVLGDGLTGFFDRGHRMLPAIVGTFDLVGTGRWGTMVGRSRRIALADETSMVETLQVVDAPHRAAYRMSELTGPFALLFRGVDGEWTFAPADHGTRVTWRWTLLPRNPLGRVATPLIASMWQGYAAKAFERIQQTLNAPDPTTDAVH